MRYDYIDPFVATTIRVLDTALHGTVRKGEVTVMQGERVKGDVAVRVGIRGDAEGDMILSMDTPTALRICRALFGEAAGSVTPQGEDAIMELANMITGNAVSALNDQGFDFSVSPPSVVARDSGAGSAAEERESLQISLLSECGAISMNVALGAT